MVNSIGLVWLMEVDRSHVHVVCSDKFPIFTSVFGRTLTLHYWVAYVGVGVHCIDY